MITERNLQKKAGPSLTSRSLNVLKKSEKGLLSEYQRSFSFWKKSSATGDALLTLQKRLSSSWMALLLFIVGYWLQKLHRSMGVPRPEPTTL
jgi:hypothetical protein